MAYTPDHSFTDSSVTFYSSTNNLTPLIPQYQIKYPQPNVEHIYTTLQPSLITQEIYEAITAQVTVVLDAEQLQSSQTYTAYTLPLSRHFMGRFPFHDGQDLWEVPHALLACRMNFLQEVQDTTRAEICQMIAIELLPFYVNSMGVFTGVSTLDMAIKAQADRFMTHPLVVNIINQLWNGEVSVNMRPGSNYRLSRLGVPRYLAILCFASYLILTALYLLVLLQPTSSQFSLWEIFLAIWGTGTLLSEIVQLEKDKIRVRLNHPSQYFDGVSFMILAGYVILRLKWIDTLNSWAPDLLTFLAPLLLPRVCWLGLKLSPHKSAYWSKMAREFLINFTVGVLVITVLSFGLWLALIRVFSTETVPLSWRLLSQAWDNESWLACTTWAQGWILASWIYMRIIVMIILIDVIIRSDSPPLNEAAWMTEVIEAVEAINCRLFYYIPPFNLLEWAARPLKWILSERSYEGLNWSLIKVSHAPVLMFFKDHRTEPLKNHHEEPYHEEPQYGSFTQTEDYFNAWHDRPTKPTCYTLIEAEDDTDINAKNDNDQNDISDNEILTNENNENNNPSNTQLQRSFLRSPPLHPPIHPLPRIPLLRKRSSMYYLINGTGLLLSPLLSQSDNGSGEYPIKNHSNGSKFGNFRRGNGLVWRVLSERSVADLYTPQHHEIEESSRWTPEDIDEMV
ncbi:hypothetical protein NADFUDRAFT_41076 [Nadsonia fulvescens var. elongata DSM 6958]|uniref:Uncharacterized protein n=1 Tax=Nadsonia fulvescens var. elongata DSM 6958 TaxID=857566 RepID=A0A1E3PLW5_9ASCO|nr:hypothetical protein NADFUDRAFT_41076 [Nadsonia fulvescens var. elongata DSM 6958]